MHYRVDGSRDLVMTTYHSGDGWYLEIPEDWTGEFSMRRQESSTIGVRTVTFAEGRRHRRKRRRANRPLRRSAVWWAATVPARPCQGNRFILYADSTTIYTAEFLESGWDCGLDQEGLKAGSMRAWTAGTPGSKCPRNTKTQGEPRLNRAGEPPQI